MREKFKDLRFEEKAKDWIAKANDLQEEYSKQGFDRLTLRQIHYQFVRRIWYENTPKNYKSLGQILSKARIAGLLDWDLIEDRGRQPHVNQEWNSLQGLLDSAFASYRLPRWKGQSHYVELWVEKEALAGVLLPLASEYHVSVMVNKGYSSSSAMKASADRFIANCYPSAHEDESDQNPKRPVILYLGDLDPSGEDMVRDIAERMALFGVPDIEVVKVALNHAQVKEYKCPPNFVKMKKGKFKDARAAKYVAEHGRECYEVDALSMPVLQDLIREAIEPMIDSYLMNVIKKQEAIDKKEVTKAAKRLAADAKKKAKKIEAKAKKLAKKKAAAAKKILQAKLKRTEKIVRQALRAKK